MDENNNIVDTIYKGSFGNKTFKAIFVNVTKRALTNSNADELGIAKSGDVIIPDLVKSNETGEYHIITSISFSSNSPFYKNNDVTSVRLPNTITEISTNAFYGCSNLKCNFT